MVPPSPTYSGAVSFVRPTVVISLELVHDSDLGTQAFARHVGEQLPDDRARLVVAGMRGILEGRPDLVAEASRAFPGVDVTAVTAGPDLVAALAAAAGLPADRIADARTAAAHDLARSAWTVGPAPGLVELRRTLTAHGHRLAVLAPGPVGVPEILDAIEMPDAPWVVVPRTQQAQWWRDAVRPPSATELRTAEAEPNRPPRSSPPTPSDHLAIAARPADLDAPADAGVRTALVDRFGAVAAAGYGADRRPTWTATDLPGLLPPIATWLRGR